jgi:hypothetical protein
MSWLYPVKVEALLTETVFAGSVREICIESSSNSMQKQYVQAGMCASMGVLGAAPVVLMLATRSVCEK